MHRGPFPMNHLTSFVERGTGGRQALEDYQHSRTLPARKAVTAEQRPQPSSLAGPTNLQPKLCGQAGGPVWRHRWDGVNKKLQLVPSPAWGYHKALSIAGSGGWSLLPPSPCRVTIITAPLEVTLLLQPGQKLAWCTPHACMWLGCIMWMISPKLTLDKLHRHSGLGCV